MNKDFILEAINLTSTIAGLEKICLELYRQSEDSEIKSDDLEALIQVIRLVYKAADKHANNLDYANLEAGDQHE